MARRRAKRRPSGVKRNFPTQKQKLAAQRNPLLQGPRNPPVQGPRLAIPKGPLSAPQAAPRTVRPAPGPDIWAMGRNAIPKPDGVKGFTQLLQGLVALRNMMTPAGAAAAVMAPRPVADSTLRGALKSGSYKPQQGPRNPDKGLTRAQSFDKAFAAARKAGKAEFTWNGNRYNTKLK